MRLCNALIFIFWIISFVLMAAAPAHADCVDPAAPEGTQTYNTTYKTMQFCDGTTWWDMKAANGGGGQIEFDECQPGEAIIFNATSGRAECPFDHTPDAFSFAGDTGVEPSTLIESDIVQIASVDDDTDISISGDGSPEYRICDDATCSAAPSYTSAGGTIDAGQYVQLRLTSSAEFETTFAATVIVGDSSDQWDVTTKEDFATAIAFTANDTWAVPAGITQLWIKVWGAAGGGQPNNNSEYGGAGGYVEGILAVTPGETIDIIVGTGGKSGGASPGAGGALNGGTAANTGSQDGGGGGGFSSVERGGSRRLVAGGGGGAGYHSTTGASHGGPAGGLAGYDGTGNRAGLGGTQSAGGTGDGNPGYSYGGGNGAASTYGGGGGGAGYWGGAGGGATPGLASGGGGGSSYIDPVVSNGIMLDNGGAYDGSAPNTDDVDYVAGISVGTTGDGGPGYVVIRY